MESDSSLLSGGDTTEISPSAPAPARNDVQSGEGVPGSDLMAKEGDFVGLDQNKKLEMSKLLDHIHERASSVLKFSIEWEEIEKRYHTMDHLLKERATEVELKEKSVMERIVELEKKEERLKEVEERERKIGLLENSMTVRIEEKEKGNDLKQYLESSLMRLVLEKVSEEVTNDLEERGKEVERLSKLNHEKSCALERTMNEFDLKQKVETERRSKESEQVKECLKQLEARDKEISLLEEAIRELVEAEKKEEIFEAEQKAKAEEMELKRKSLEETEKKLEEREKELDLKRRELEERLIQADTCKEEIFEAEQNAKAEELELKRKEKKLEEREKELDLKQRELEERLIQADTCKEEIFEAEQNAKAEELELKRKEKKLEEREKELDLKQRELEERLIQADTCKRSRVNLLEEESSDAESLVRPAKKQKPHSHDDANKEKALDCVVSDCTSSFHQTNEATEEETDEDPEQLNCVDSEFHDFKVTMSSFVVGTVWALYDPTDDMPRLYAKIKGIQESPARLEVTWLESRDEESVHVACGRYKYGETQTMKGHLAFSHEMQPIIHGKNFITVNPMKGETWALFRDWSNNPEQHKPPYKYDFVEVVLSFDDSIGVGVTYLGKVDGFVSVFEHAPQHGIYSLVIPPEEMHIFSHRVPSVRMNGEEKEGVPAGSFELDTAAIPTSMPKLDHSVRE